MQNELQKISTWFKAIKLSPDISKTKYSFFNSQNRKSEIPQHFSLKIYDTLVERAKTSKSLGVVLNENLSWKSHMDTLALNISKSIGIIFTQPVFTCLKLTRETLEQM